MNFEEAVGKKVKNENTGEERRVISYSEGPHVTLEADGGDRIGFRDGSSLSYEWKLVEENETLSDKATGLGATEKEYLYVKDVKASLKEVQKESRIYLSGDLLTIKWSKFKEIFGERLIG